MSNLFSDSEPHRHGDLLQGDGAGRSWTVSICNRRDFGIEPEITQKVAAMRARVYEVPISYNGRTYDEGKKIGLKDAFKAVYTILRFCRWKPK